MDAEKLEANQKELATMTPEEIANEVTEIFKFDLPEKWGEFSEQEMKTYLQRVRNGDSSVIIEADMANEKKE